MISRPLIIGAALAFATAACGSPQDAPAAPGPESPPADMAPSPSAESEPEPIQAQDAPAPAETPATAEPEPRPESRSDPRPESESPASVVEAPPAPTPAPVRTASPSAPPAAFASCRSCHTVERDGPHRIGPNLFGVVNAPAGAKSGFNYSEAMAQADVTWTEDQLDAFLAAPRETIPGNRMMAPPVRDPEARRSIIAYLAGLD